MKNLFLILAISWMMSSCKSNSVQAPEAMLPEIIGKWQLAEVKVYKNSSSTAPEWRPFESVHIMEFKKSGEVFINGELQNTCCGFNFYKQNGNSIIIENKGREKLDCSMVKCPVTIEWETLRLTSDSLRVINMRSANTIKSDDGHERYVRVK
jgi:hypothetical protein